MDCRTVQAHFSRGMFQFKSHRKCWTLLLSAVVLLGTASYSLLTICFSFEYDRGFQNYICWKNLKSPLHHHLSTLKSCLMNLPRNNSRKSTKLTFIGDSRLRQIHLGIYRLLAPNPSIPKELHQDFSYFIPSLNFGADFVWSESLGDRRVRKHLTKLTQRAPSNRPTIIFLNDGAWTMMYCGDGYRLKFPGISGINGGHRGKHVSRCFRHYRQSIKSFVRYVHELSSHSRVIWTQQNPVWSARRLDAYAGFITTNTSRQMNGIAQKFLQNSTIDFWQTYYDIFAADLHDSPDGLHLGNRTLQLATEIIFQSLCGIGDNFMSFQPCP